MFFYLWAESSRVQEERAEALEKIGHAKSKGRNRVRSHLAEIVEVAALELGWSQLEDMGIVLAGQVAELVATVGKGLLRDQNDDWWAIENGVPVVLVGPRSRG